VPRGTAFKTCWIRLMLFMLRGGLVERFGDRGSTPFGSSPQHPHAPTKHRPLYEVGALSPRKRRFRINRNPKAGNPKANQLLSHAGPKLFRTVVGQARHDNRAGYSEKIFPGFMMFLGSSARLMVRIMSTAPAPASLTRKPILCNPTPCSPVQVPSRLSARATSL